MLPPHEGPKPGYTALSSPVIVPNPDSGTIDVHRTLPSTLAIPMGSVVTLRRQLAPTVGHALASTGVLIRTGPSSSSSVR